MNITYVTVNHCIYIKTRLRYQSFWNFCYYRAAVINWVCARDDCFHQVYPVDRLLVKFVVNSELPFLWLL